MSRRILMLASLILVASSCHRAADLGRLWKERALQQKSHFDERDALVAFFDAKYRALAYDVWADEDLASFLRKDQPLERYELVRGKVCGMFYERYGIQPPQYFPPFNDAFGFTRDFTEAQVPIAWRETLAERGLTRASEVQHYLATWEAARQHVAADEER